MCRPPTPARDEEPAADLSALFARRVSPRAAAAASNKPIGGVGLGEHVAWSDSPLAVLPAGRGPESDWVYSVGGWISGGGEEEKGFTI
ncbi:hypothetical protein EYF80_059093 [Liparis tanakae]|uniref:Uncharacterized protein n=1 Tax=Liparis tanakae TaxID=230148 RepID=A0A4Z2EQW4_9TELE|nr:hypothetical protein EYF80_059093 [Liparis tanakae]